MVTELTAKLEELREVSGAIRPDLPPATALKLIAEQHALFDQCIALSKQPPVYAMSRDYALLYDHLVKGGKPEAWCYSDSPKDRFWVSPMKMEDGDVVISTRMHESYGDKKEFVKRCELWNLEWLAPSPQAVTVEGLSPVWSPAQDEFDTPCWVTGCKCAIGPVCKPYLYCYKCGTPIDHSKVDVDKAPASTNT